MAALAGMLAARGFRVTGSDNQLYEPTASQLRALQIEIRNSYDAANLVPAPDLVVVGNVVPRANPEAQALLASSIPYVSMPEALWHLFLRDRRVLMVAGTHGKTTSTAMMAHVLEAAGRDPSMLVGGVALDFGSNYRLGNGRDFVIEGDEYDTAFFDKGPKFLHYGADGAIITAVEFDHADIYRDLDHVKSSFRALVAQMDATRVMVVCADFPNALEVSAETRARRLTFGLKSGEYRATNIIIGAAGARFSIERGDRGSRVADDLKLPIGGRMNVANALGVWLLLREFGLSEQELARGLESFRRREAAAGDRRRRRAASRSSTTSRIIRPRSALRSRRSRSATRVAGYSPRSSRDRIPRAAAFFSRASPRAFDRAARVYLARFISRKTIRFRLPIGSIPRCLRLRLRRVARGRLVCDNRCDPRTDCRRYAIGRRRGLHVQWSFRRTSAAPGRGAERRQLKSYICAQPETRRAIAHRGRSWDARGGVPSQYTIGQLAQNFIEISLSDRRADDFRTAEVAALAVWHNASTLIPAAAQPRFQPPYLQTPGIRPRRLTDAGAG